MGEVIPNQNSDGVFTGREPHNTHRNQMKFFKAIAATAAVITCCIGNPIPAKAGIVIDLHRGEVTEINDGNPHLYYVQGCRTSTNRRPLQGAAYPTIAGERPGFKRTRSLSQSLHQQAAQNFREDDRDGLTYRNGYC